MGEERMFMRGSCGQVYSRIELFRGVVHWKM